MPGPAQRRDERRRTVCVATAMVAAGLGLGLLGCGAAPFRRYPLAEVMWNDPDRATYRTPPEEYESMGIWDGMDNTFSLPLGELLRVRPDTEAVNVNALDEVPDSSWFTNRIGRHGMTPDELANGACTTWDAPPTPWTITSGKPDGVNPGFFFKDAKGQRYLLKADGPIQPERNSGADAIAALLYHAAGYFVPCNRVVEFDAGSLRIKPGATVKTSTGEKVPLTEVHLRMVLDKANVLPNGKLRAGISQFIDGTPLGPWTYFGRKEDDPNDVVPHEERRELRGMRVLASLGNLVDSREQNTMMSWMKGPDGRGHVRHYRLDLSDAFGAMWATSDRWAGDTMSRRLGHAYYLDFADVGQDLVTLGLIERPWDRARLSASGSPFGYFSSRDFDPDNWHSGYPNPAFSRATERDNAWMARILAEITDAHLEAANRRGRWTNASHGAELVRILRERRGKILERYLTRLSPLAKPVALDGKVCLVDLAVRSGIRKAATRVYRSAAYAGDSLASVPVAAPVADGERVCARLPPVPGASPDRPGYLVVDLVASTPGRETTGPARVHLYHLGGGGFRVVALARPESAAPPVP